jgi:hypothetical protein
MTVGEDEQLVVCDSASHELRGVERVKACCDKQKGGFQLL